MAVTTKVNQRNEEMKKQKEAMLAAKNGEEMLKIFLTTAEAKQVGRWEAYCKFAPDLWINYFRRPIWMFQENQGKQGFGLDDKTRTLVMIAALTAFQDANGVEFHATHALQAGTCTIDEIMEVVFCVLFNKSKNIGSIIGPGLTNAIKAAGKW